MKSYNMPITMITHAVTTLLGLPQRSYWVYRVSLKNPRRARDILLAKGVPMLEHFEPRTDLSVGQASQEPAPPAPPM
jgi:hypothetical protein